MEVDRGERCVACEGNKIKPLKLHPASEPIYHLGGSLSIYNGYNIRSVARAASHNLTPEKLCVAQCVSCRGVIFRYNLHHASPKRGRGRPRTSIQFIIHAHHSNKSRFLHY